MTVCLDAWAVVAWLQNDPAASRMQAHVGDSRCCMSWVNAGEVHYVVHRRTDRHTADRVIAQLRVDVDLIDATGARALDAAAIKATHRMSYADCFAAATALEFGVPLITRDPEIIAARIDGLKVIDLDGR